ncbi:MAG: diguanylate cyclase [Candidatus Omnitrophica bacterium]|nr:diguanylate cyclase [Candidatus Omnitrophota bacterium]
MKKYRTVSLVHYSLKYKSIISFCLLLIIPILISIYIISFYFLPLYKWNYNILVLIAVCFFSGLSGFLLINDFVRRIMQINKKAKSMVSHRLDSDIILSEKDEITQLTDIINDLEKKIHQDMQQLNVYSKKTAEYNTKIQRQTSLLSSLLQMNSMVSSGKDIFEIIQIALERLCQVTDSSVAYIAFKEEDSDDLYIRITRRQNVFNSINIKLKFNREINRMFEYAIRQHSAILIDSKSTLSKELIQELSACFKVDNLLLFPIYIRNRFLGFLIIGNNQPDFIYNEDDVEIVEIFTMNMCIIMEISELLKQLEKLETRDALTGVYNERFIRQRLEEEIKRSILYQRPCGFALFRIDNFKMLDEHFGIRFAENILRKVALILKESITEVDYVGRFGEYTFALILVERNKRQSIKCAEDIRKKIEFIFSGEPLERRIILKVAVSENPLDGVTADELINNAEQNLKCS